jgi:hypothetical protein
VQNNIPLDLQKLISKEEKSIAIDFQPGHRLLGGPTFFIPSLPVNPFGKLKSRGRELNGTPTSQRTAPRHGA